MEAPLKRKGTGAKRNPLSGTKQAKGHFGRN